MDYLRSHKLGGHVVTLRPSGTISPSRMEWVLWAIKDGKTGDTIFEGKQYTPPPGHKSQCGKDIARALLTLVVRRIDGGSFGIFGKIYDLKAADYNPSQIAWLNKNEKTLVGECLI